MVSKENKREWPITVFNQQCTQKNIIRILQIRYLDYQNKLKILIFEKVQFWIPSTVDRV